MTVSTALFPTDSYARVLFKTNSIPEFSGSLEEDDETFCPGNVDDEKYKTEPFKCDRIKESVLAVNAYYR